MDWLTNTTSGWDFGAVPTAQWYAVQDAEDNLRAAQVDMHDDGAIVYAAQIDPETNRPKAMYLAFPKEGDEYVLSEYAYVSLTEPLRPVEISELKEPLEGVYMAQLVSVLGVPLFIPMSVEPFTITAENGPKMKLVFTDVANISDISSTSLQMLVRDIYAYETDITDQVLNTTEEVVDVGLLDVPSATYNGHEQAPKVYYKGELLAQGRDYEWLKLDSTDGFIDAGDHEIALVGIGRFANLARKTFTISPKPVAPAFSLSATSYKWNDKEKKPKVVVKVGSTALAEGADYTVAYAKGRKNVGKYSVTVKCKGNYTFSAKALSFKINPKGTSLRKVVAGSKRLTVRWAKQSKKMSSSKVTGYRIQLSTSKNFKKANKYVKVKGAAKTSKVVTKLKADKRYYVRIQTYKTVNGKTCYSAWSAKKSAVTRKNDAR